MYWKRKTMFVFLGALSATALIAGACGDDDDDDDANGGEGGNDLTAASVDCKDLGLAAPARIKEAGKFVVASDLSYAPMEFVNMDEFDAWKPLEFKPDPN